MENTIDIDTTVWKTVTRKRSCNRCELDYEDNIFVPPGNWVIDTTPNQREIQSCLKCGDKFVDKFTTTDRKFYPSPPPPKRQGKYRVLIIDGKCECGSDQGYSNEEWHFQPGVTWTPKNHMQHPVPAVRNTG